MPSLLVQALAEYRQRASASYAKGIELMKKKYHKDSPCDASFYMRIPSCELEAWRKEAAQAGLTLSKYIRRCVAGRKIEIVVTAPIELDAITDIAAEYGKIGSNINQIAHHLNSGLKFSGSLYNRLSDAVDEMGEVTRKLAKEVKDINGNYQAQSLQRFKL